MTWSLSHLSLRSQDYIALVVPPVCTEFGRKAFSYSVPATWTKLQSGLVHFGEFKGLFGRLEKATVFYFIFLHFALQM